jgi:hypothetical protein
MRELLTEAGRLRALGDVMAWAFAQRPPLALVDVVVQDEYTHDVVLAAVDGRHLVFDTT